MNNESISKKKDEKAIRNTVVENEQNNEELTIEDLKMKEDEIKKEIEEFNKEKERIKKFIGEIGGTTFSKKDRFLNIIFLLVILVFFVLELTTHILPSYVSLEVGVLLVSIKIVWMIHSQNKYNHYVFWVLNSIEYRTNELSKKIKGIEKMIRLLEEKL